jgi:hypothetical protein
VHAGADALSARRTPTHIPRRVLPFSSFFSERRSSLARPPACPAWWATPPPCWSRCWPAARSRSLRPPSRFSRRVRAVGSACAACVPSRAAAPRRGALAARAGATRRTARTAARTRRRGAARGLAHASLQAPTCLCLAHVPFTARALTPARPRGSRSGWSCRGSSP